MIQLQGAEGNKSQASLTLVAGAGRSARCCISARFCPLQSLLSANFLYFTEWKSIATTGLFPHLLCLLEWALAGCGPEVKGRAGWRLTPGVSSSSGDAPQQPGSSRWESRAGLVEGVQTQGHTPRWGWEKGFETGRSGSSVVLLTILL